MSVATIILFFAYTYGIGFAVTNFLKNSENFLERNLMRIGIGLGVLPFLIVVFSWLHIPLDWRIFLIVSLIFPVFYLFKNYKHLKFNLKLNKSNLYTLIVLLLFIATFFMYSKGAFAYPWLEDDDPWTYAYGAKYVSIEKTVFEPIPGKNSFQYLDAYPPAYPALIGILHQTSPSLIWTLKFFNALIISLSIIFFYFFVKEFTGSKSRALFSTLVLALIPCFLSHFIWSYALIIPLIFPMFYAFERIKYDKKWAYISALLFSGLWFINLTHSIKITVLLFLYLIVKILIEKREARNWLSPAIFGLLIAFLLWWLPMMLKYGDNFWTLGLNQHEAGIEATADKPYIGVMGSASRLYTFNDFFFAKTQNMINNPIGVGIVLSILLSISLLYLIFEYKSLIKKQNSWKLIALFWLVFTFLGIHGGSRIPIALWSFRFWMLFAIPLSIIASEGMWFLMTLSKSFKINRYFILTIVIIGLILTSGYQKYAVNTAQWGPGGWLGPIQGETEGFLWLNQLPLNTKVFVFSRMNKFPIGLDKFSCEWCQDVVEFREKGINGSVQEVHSWLTEKNYEFALIDWYYAQSYGINQTNERIDEFASSGLFQPAYQTQSVVIFRVV